MLNCMWVGLRIPYQIFLPIDLNQAQLLFLMNISHISDGKIMNMLHLKNLFVNIKEILITFYQIAGSPSQVAVVLT